MCKALFPALNAVLKGHAQHGVRHEQELEYEYDRLIDPTHTLIAKDGTDHPLHELAGEVAKEAVKAEAKK